MLTFMFKKKQVYQINYPLKVAIQKIKIIIKNAITSLKYYTYIIMYALHNMVLVHRNIYNSWMETENII